MKKKSLYLSYVLLLPLLLSIKNAYTASATATATVTIIQPLLIEQLSDLSFGEVNAGSSAKTIAPNAGGGVAAFKIVGAPNSTFSITLPQKITLTGESTGNGASNIEIHSFKSHPENSGRVDAQGETQLFIGATLSEIDKSVTAGTYSADFTVSVVYQ